ncbi:MAG TPA: hypothetical protein PLU55_01505 [Candidatus Pacearchaeota archaeon]|nr:hypothetical protein [Candidatus Pacearchaeota archaeon]
MSKPLRNFDKFEEGHYYVYTGEKTDKWANAMEAVLERKIHKCLETPCSNKEGAIFEGVEDGYWNYKDGFDNWVEVESPDAVFEKGDDCLVFRKSSKEWHIAPLINSGFFSCKNMFENTSFVIYILKRKNKKEESVTKNKRYLCPYCKNDRTGFLGLTSKKGESVKCGNCGTKVICVNKGCEDDYINDLVYITSVWNNYEIIKEPTYRPIYTLEEYIEATKDRKDLRAISKDGTRILSLHEVDANSGEGIIYFSGNSSRYIYENYVWLDDRTLVGVKCS